MLLIYNINIFVIELNDLLNAPSYIIIFIINIIINILWLYKK